VQAMQSPPVHKQVFPENALGQAVLKQGESLTYRIIKMNNAEIFPTH
jgi:hypothetical protein